MAGFVRFGCSFLASGFVFTRCFVARFWLLPWFLNEQILDVWLIYTSFSRYRFRCTLGYLWGEVCTCRYVRVALTVTKHIGDHLFITRGFRLVVDQNVPIRLCTYASIHVHKVWAVFGKNPLCDKVNLFSVTRAAKQNHILRTSGNICVKFSLGKHVL